MGKILACMALVALAVSPAWSAERGEGENVVDGKKTGQSQSWHDGTDWHILGTHNNGPNFTVSNPPQGWVYYYPTVIQASSRPNTATLFTAVADSTAPMEARGATRWLVEIFPTFDDSVGGALFALQLRGHPIEAIDSLTTFAFEGRRSRPIGTSGSTPADTLGSLSLATNGGVLGTILGAVMDSTAYATEYIIPLGHGPHPRGRSYLFEGFASDFISLRMRVLQTYQGTAASFLPIGKDPLTQYKVNLYGYR